MRYTVKTEKGNTKICVSFFLTAFLLCYCFIHRNSSSELPAAIRVKAK